MTSLNLHTRVYRTFLLAYPRAFRQVYGGDMAQVFSDRLRKQGVRVVGTAPGPLREAARAAMKSCVPELPL